jgi:outer membrane protein
LSVDFDIGKLISYKPLHGTYIGWALKHRSGIFGLINNVRKGGSNYNTIFLERNF